jgi:mRNA interferase RelE/StbE
MKTIIYTVQAAKDLDALPGDISQQITAGLEVYAMTGRGDVKALQGRPGYRLRVGRYRVIFAEDRVTVLALTIGKRDSQTYR